MTKSVRAACGMGSLPKQFVTNRVECLKSHSKREAGRNVLVDQLVESIQELVERQQRNVEWALLNKGPLKLRISMRHFAIKEDHWYSMLPKDRKKQMAKFKKTDISDTILSVKERSLETTKVTDELSLLANTALALDEKEEKNNDHLSVSLQDFRQYVPNLSELTANGIYKKACALVYHVGKMTIVPKGNPKSRMVASTRLRERPHLVEKGKTEGEYMCEKTCPHYTAPKLCSHVIATAEANKDLKPFLQFYAKKKDEEKMNLSRLLRTDMPSNPGCKGGKPSTSRSSTPKLPIEER